MQSSLMNKSSDHAEIVTKDQLEQFGTKLMARVDDHLHRVIHQLANVHPPHEGQQPTDGAQEPPSNPP